MALIDYNLLRSLRVLLEERSVTRAARALNVSQPAMSAALARLRTHYGDPLLIRRNNERYLSPLGERLLCEVPSLVEQTEHVLRREPHFDAGSSTRNFTIAGIDYVIGRIAPGLTRMAAAEAPLIRFEFPEIDSTFFNALPESLRTVDVVSLPHGYLVDQPHIDLPPEQWVCLVDKSSGLSPYPSMDEILSRPWVQNTPAREGMNPVRTQLHMQGIEVKVAAVTPHLFVLPSLVVGTNRVCVVPDGMAKIAITMHPQLMAVTPPFHLQILRDALWWRPELEFDSDHIWLHGLLERVAKEVTL